MPEPRKNALEHLQRLLSEPDSQRSEHLDDAATLDAVDELTDALGSESDDIAIRHALGWWHHLTSQRPAPESPIRHILGWRHRPLRRRPLSEGSPSDHATKAIELLRPLYAQAPDKVPTQVAGILESQGLDSAGQSLMLLRRYLNGDAPADLDQAIAVGWNAVDAIPDWHPARARCQAILGIALKARFDRTGDLADLREAITTGREAIEAVPQGHPDRAGYLSYLGIALRTRFDWTGDLADLQEAIAVDRGAIEAVPGGQPARATYLINLGIALRTRFDRTGDLSDLQEAITVAREAIEAVPDGHPDRAGYLAILGSALQARFKLAGELADLQEAITAARRAVEATTDGPPVRAGHLSILGTALQASFDRTGDMAELQEAITVAREAIEAVPEGHPDRAAYLSYLGIALRTRFDWTGDLADLQEAIAVGREALGAAPAWHPEQRSWRLSTLAAALQTRFERTEDLADLQEAIAVAQDAVEATFAEHPDRAMLLANLGHALRTLFERTGAEADRVLAVSAFKAAARSPNAAPSVVCFAAGRYGSLVEGEEAIAAFGIALQALPLVASRSLGFEDAAERVRILSWLGRDAAAAMLDVGDAEGALTALESARAITFSRVLQARGDLTDLADAQPELAQRLEVALSVLDCGPSTASDIRPDTRDWAGASAVSAATRAAAAATLAAQSRHKAEVEVEATLQQIRELPGWDRFFMPATIAKLSQAAQHGPIVVVNTASRRCDALIVTPSGVEHLPLPGLTETDALRQAGRFLAVTHALSLATTTNQRSAAEIDVSEVADWLWDSIAEPILTHLGHRGPRLGTDYEFWPRVWWMPTGPLTVLPLHAAGHHNPPGQPWEIHRRKTVIDRVVSSTIPTIGALTHSRTRPTPTEAEQQVLIAAMPHTPPLEQAPVADLPGTEEEATRITESLGANRCTVLAEFSPAGLAPTKATLTAQLPHYAWAHLACHAMTDWERPTRSTLLLHDHVTNPYTVLDLTDTRFPHAQLAYLSACSTARPGLNQLDEPIHFAAAALMAGYRNVIATLWPMRDDAETADLIYRDLTHNQPIDWTASGAAAAVHHATHQQRNTRGATVHEWANHTHHGP